MRPRSSDAPRLHNLDYLRGIAASGIMVYHYLSWTFGELGAGTVLGRVGIYGVAVFYVLSGLTMHHVYYRRIASSSTVSEFFIALRVFFVRRVFRIFPLLWLVTIAALVLAWQPPDWGTVFLNLSGLFGFVKWDAYISTGVWSIGNELVFYALFPLIVLAARWRRVALYGLGLLILVPYLYFAFFGIDANATPAANWTNYVNPLNQAFLFFGGFLIGHLLRTVKLPRVAAYALVAGALVAFVLWPATGDSVTLMTGTNRIAFTVICFALCAGAYKLAIDLPNAVHVPLSAMGEASYSVYLIHPIAFTAFSIVLAGRIDAPLLAIVGIVATVVGSLLCYRLFEKPLTELGRRLTTPKVPSDEVTPRP